MAGQWRPSYKFIQEVQQMPVVRAKLREVRDRKARQVTMLAFGEGVRVNVTVDEGTRPKGRSYGRIMIPAVDEFGDSKTKRLRLLGRVASSR